MKSFILVLTMVMGLNSVAKADFTGGDSLRIVSQASTVATAGGAIVTCSLGILPACVPLVVTAASGAAAYFALGLSRYQSLQDNSPLVEQAYAGHGEMIESLASQLNVSVETASQIVLDTKASLDAKN